MAWRTVSVTEGVRLDENGNFTRTRIVRYMVDSNGPFQLEVPAATPEAEIRRQIEEQARLVEGLARGSG